MKLERNNEDSVKWMYNAIHAVESIFQIEGIIYANFGTNHNDSLSVNFEFRNLRLCQIIIISVFNSGNLRSLANKIVYLSRTEQL